MIIVFYFVCSKSSIGHDNIYVTYTYISGHNLSLVSILIIGLKEKLGGFDLMFYNELNNSHGEDSMAIRNGFLANFIVTTTFKDIKQGPKCGKVTLIITCIYKKNIMGY